MVKVELNLQYLIFNYESDLNAGQISKAKQLMKNSL